MSHTPGNLQQAEWMSFQYGTSPNIVCVTSFTVTDTGHGAKKHTGTDAGHGT
jgi:hypothetical protein